MDRFTIRKLCEKDLQNGLLETLNELSPTSEIRQEIALIVFRRLQSNPNCLTIVAELNRRVVGTATLWINDHFIHNGGCSGQIEDVAVRSNTQSRGIGQALVQHLLKYAVDAGCYKTTLFCNDFVASFYSKLGFKNETNGMCLRH